jgi:Protein of unknown function (DUF2510)
MGLFETSAVKELKKEAGYVGGLYAGAHGGDLSTADLIDVTQHKDFRSRLRQAFAAAARDIGEAKALKEAVKSARIECDAYCYVRHRDGGPGNCRDTQRAAEETIREILASPAPGHEPGQTIRSPSILTISGRPQPTPETSDSIERRIRLYVECERRLTGHPLAGQDARGGLLGPGSGLEHLVALIAPLFQREQSLIRWVAIRGAVACLYMNILDPRSAKASAEDFACAMGFRWIDSAGRPYTDEAQGDVSFVVQDQSGRMPRELKNAAAATIDTVMGYLADYRRFTSMNLADAIVDPFFSKLDDAAALDCIAWSAVARLRMGLAQQVSAKVPEPDALPEPGWYTEPLTAKCERYWDGYDWKSACRLADGGRSKEFTLPLRAR